jgi:hypothetical protein
MMMKFVPVKGARPQEEMIEEFSNDLVWKIILSLFVGIVFFLGMICFGTNAIWIEGRPESDDDDNNDSVNWRTMIAESREEEEQWYADGNYHEWAEDMGHDPHQQHEFHDDTEVTSYAESSESSELDPVLQRSLMEVSEAFVNQINEFFHQETDRIPPERVWPMEVLWYDEVMEAIDEFEESASGSAGPQ